LVSPQQIVTLRSERDRARDVNSDTAVPRTTVPVRAIALRLPHAMFHPTIGQACAPPAKPFVTIFTY
jgi:hypothetical protein